MSDDLVRDLFDAADATPLPFERVVELSARWAAEGTAAWKRSTDGAAVAGLAVLVHGDAVSDYVQDLIAARARAAIGKEPASAYALGIIGGRAWRWGRGILTEGRRYLSAYAKACESLQWIDPTFAEQFTEANIAARCINDALVDLGVRKAISERWIAQRVRARFAAPTLAQVHALFAGEAP